MLGADGAAEPDGAAELDGGLDGTGAARFDGWPDAVGWGLAGGPCPRAARTPGISRYAPVPPSSTTMTRKASTRWRGDRSIATRYFFRRTGRSQKGPGGLSGRPLLWSSGGSAPGWLPPLPGPVGRFRAGGVLRAGPRAGLGLRAGL